MVLVHGLTRARERMGYRRGDAAAALGVTRAMISCWENGRRELAHVLFHSGPETRFLLSGAAKSPQERFADRFAGEFLMPAEGIRRVMEEYGVGPRVAEPADVVHLQSCFKVSYATALVRLRQGGFLSQQDYRAFRSARPVAIARALGLSDCQERLQPRPR